ncbi:hypothetical protein ACFRCG_06770 [Embleya sp. NPDC056575]|uniref:hypothetical protein n=1 Tax=unclassified Embleya TaxID=2699296 RepID=UPI0036C3CAC4
MRINPTLRSHIALMQEQNALDNPSRNRRRPRGTILQVERFFNRHDEKPSSSVDDTNLFGRRLDRAVVDFLAATGADLDVGEYDMTPSDD